MVSPRRVAAALVVSALSWTVAVPGLVLTTAALFAATTGASPQTFAGVTFSPEVAPVPVATLVNEGIRLEWPSVNLSNGSPAQYEVVRTGTDTSVQTVCTGSAQPVRLSTTDTCTDTTIQADVNYTYAERPILKQNSQITWSRPFSTSSSSLLAPKLRFGGVGPAATSTSAVAVTVSYPSGSTVGDVAILVVRHSRKTPVTAPTGWSPLVELANNGPQSYLLVAWKVVDTETSVSVQTQGTPQGSSAWVVLYKRTQGNTSTPITATTTVVAENGVAATTFSNSLSTVTNVNNAAVISIATVLAANTLSLATANGYTLRAADTATSGGNGFALGIADQIAVKNAVTVSPPTWSQSGTAAFWQVATIAFS